MGRTSTIQVLTLLVAALLVPACGGLPQRAQGNAGASESPDLDAAFAEARASDRPLLVLMSEPEKNADERVAHDLLSDPDVRAHADQVVFVDLDVRNSRSRATARRLNMGRTPSFLTISSRGVGIARVEPPWTRARLLEALHEARSAGRELDARLVELERPLETDPDDPVAQLRVGRFLSDHGSWDQAVSHLETAALSERAGLSLDERIAAWCALCRAQFRSGNAEKGRHLAERLIDTLGPQDPAAIAASWYVRGEHDLDIARPDRAVGELDQAIRAAPDSEYGRMAQEARARLPASVR